MRLSPFAVFSLPLLVTSVANAINLDCEKIRIDGKNFDLSKLGGPHIVTVTNKDKPPSVYNTTFAIDICQALKKVNDIPDEDQCPAYSRVCGVVRSWNPFDDPDQKHVQTENVIPIAGSFEMSHGSPLDPKYTRLKASDSQTEGLQIELNGGIYDKKKQKAVIEFQCDETRTGNEGQQDAENVEKRADGETEPEDPNSLTFVSYGPVEGKETMDVLRLNWRTKYACESVEPDNDPKKTAGWGFFTWFILILFLGIAAYLIFGSWLNYNRYGARGWDLLPHGDTIRDVPYLFKDWSRKVVETVSGGGSRGGYSAV